MPCVTLRARSQTTPGDWAEVNIKRVVDIEKSLLCLPIALAGAPLLERRTELLTN